MGYVVEIRMLRRRPNSGGYCELWECKLAVDSSSLLQALALDDMASHLGKLFAVAFGFTLLTEGKC